MPYAHIKNIVKEIDRITAHYYGSTMADKRPKSVRDHQNYVIEGVIDNAVSKAGMKKGNRRK